MCRLKNRCSLLMCRLCAELGFPIKDRAIKRLVIFYSEETNLILQKSDSGSKMLSTISRVKIKLKHIVFRTQHTCSSFYPLAKLCLV